MTPPVNGQTIQISASDYAALLETVKRLQAEKDMPKSRINVSIADKGGVSVSGTGRFPITQYAEQWFTFLDGIGYSYNGQGTDLRRYVAENLSTGTIKVKGSKDESNESILKRSMALGHEVLAKLNTASVPAVVTVPASQPATTTQVAK